MKVWLRLLNIWLIAIALPVQGVAGVTMAHCGWSHQFMGAATQAAPHQHADHDAEGSHHHGSDAPDDVQLARHVTAGQTHLNPDKVSDLVQFKCSSCASCCAGSALPSTMPRVPQVAAEPAVFTEDMVTVDAFASDGPDRPPRTRLA